VKLHPARILRLAILIFVLVGIAFFISGTDANAETTSAPTSNHCVCRHNAQQKKQLANFGVYGYIQWKRTNLNGGTFTYHRVASVQENPWRYVEFGWTKNAVGDCAAVTTGNFCALIVYNPGTGDFGHAVAFTKVDHSYSAQYDPNTTKHWFYLDGANVWNVNAGFGQGTQVKGGGEVGRGVEQMNDAHLYNLAYSVNNGGGFQYVSWNGYVDAEQEAPYSNVNGGPNDFFDHGP
jgi:hypothetical protein